MAPMVGLVDVDVTKANRLLAASEPPSSLTAFVVASVARVLRDADVRDVPDLTAELRRVKRQPSASGSGRWLERAAPAARFGAELRELIETAAAISPAPLVP